jgi:hypothetical protein
MEEGGAAPCANQTFFSIEDCKRRSVTAQIAIYHNADERFFTSFVLYKTSFLSSTDVDSSSSSPLYGNHHASQHSRWSHSNSLTVSLF